MGEVGRNFDSILDLLFHPSNRVAGEWRADSSTRTTYSPLLISQNTHDASRLPCPALTRLLLLSACLHLHTLATGVQTVRAVAPSMLWTPREIPGNFKASQPRLLSPRSLPRSPLHHFVSSFRFPLRARAWTEEWRLRLALRLRVRCGGVEFPTSALRGNRGISWGAAAAARANLMLCLALPPAFLVLQQFR